MTAALAGPGQDLDACGSGGAAGLPIPGSLRAKPDVVQRRIFPRTEDAEPWRDQDVAVALASVLFAATMPASARLLTTPMRARPRLAPAPRPDRFEAFDALRDAT